MSNLSEISDAENSSLVAKCFMGVDGSGGHSIYNSPSSLASGVDTSHMLLASFTVPSMVVDDSDSK